MASRRHGAWFPFLGLALGFALVLAPPASAGEDDVATLLDSWRAGERVADEVAVEALLGYEGGGMLFEGLGYPRVGQRQLAEGDKVLERLGLALPALGVAELEPADPDDLDLPDEKMVRALRAWLFSGRLPAWLATLREKHGTRAAALAEVAVLSRLLRFPESDTGLESALHAPAVQRMLEAGKATGLPEVAWARWRTPMDRSARFSEARLLAERVALFFSAPVIKPGTLPNVRARAFRLGRAITERYVPGVLHGKAVEGELALTLDAVQLQVELPPRPEKPFPSTGDDLTRASWQAAALDRIGDALHRMRLRLELAWGTPASACFGLGIAPIHVTNGVLSLRELGPLLDEVVAWGRASGLPEPVWRTHLDAARAGSTLDGALASFQTRLHPGIEKHFAAQADGNAPAKSLLPSGAGSGDDEAWRAREARERKLREAAEHARTQADREAKQERARRAEAEARAQSVKVDVLAWKLGSELVGLGTMLEKRGALDRWNAVSTELSVRLVEHGLRPLGGRPKYAGGEPIQDHMLRWIRVQASSRIEQDLRRLHGARRATLFQASVRLHLLGYYADKRNTARARKLATSLEQLAGSLAVRDAYDRRLVQKLRGLANGHRRAEVAADIDRIFGYMSIVDVLKRSPGALK